MRTLVLCTAMVFGACGGGAGDSSVDTTSDTDTDSDTEDDTGDPIDAGPDAFDECPAQLTFTGDYVDWDSTEATFRGVPFAEVSPIDRPEDAVMTAPNGRSVLCVDAGAALDVQFVQEDYVDLVFSALPSPV